MLLNEKFYEFLKKAKEEFTLLEEMFEQMQDFFKKLSKFYCFDPKKMPMEELFGTFNTFRNDYLVSNFKLVKQIAYANMWFVRCAKQSSIASATALT